MKLPKSLTRVTWFSKMLALVLVIAFLVTAFFIGMMFQREASDVLVSITPTPTMVAGNQSACSVDSDCTLTTADTKNSCCPNIRCLNFADDDVVAVNASQLAADKQAVCGKNHMCPMILMMCTKGITQENAHYSAKCIQHICQKVKS